MLIIDILTFGKLRHYTAVLEENLSIPRRETYILAVAAIILFANIFG